MNNETIMDVECDRERLKDILKKADFEFGQLNDKYEENMSKTCQGQSENYS